MGPTFPVLGPKTACPPTLKARPAVPAVASDGLDLDSAILSSGVASKELDVPACPPTSTNSSTPKPLLERSAEPLVFSGSGLPESGLTLHSNPGGTALAIFDCEPPTLSSVPPLARSNSTQKAYMAALQGEAAQNSEAARPALLARLEKMGYRAEDLETLTQHMKNAPVVIHFSPEVELPDGRQVVDSMLTDPYIRNQFETHVSGGDSGAVPGGTRDRFEEQVFNGAYHGHPLDPHERPKYGAVNSAFHSEGPARGYGSCYFELKPSLDDQCSFTPGDSCLAWPDQVGTRDHLLHVLRDLKEPVLRETMDVALGGVATSRSFQENGGHYVEAQIHGSVDQTLDVRRLVADPKLRGTATGDKLLKMARQNGYPLVWRDQLNST